MMVSYLEPLISGPIHIGVNNNMDRLLLISLLKNTSLKMEQRSFYPPVSLIPRFLRLERAASDPKFGWTIPALERA